MKTKIKENRLKRTSYEYGKEIETIKEYFDVDKYDKVLEIDKVPLTNNKEGKNTVEVELPRNERCNGLYMESKRSKSKSLLDTLRGSKGTDEHYTALTRGDLLMVYNHDTKVSEIYNTKDSKFELLEKLEKSGQNLAPQLNKYAEKLRRKMLL